MGDINFLSENKKTTEGHNPSGNPNIRWSEPESSGNNGAPISKLYSRVPKNGKRQDEEYLKKSKQEVLRMIKEEKAAEKPKADKARAEGFFAGFFKVFAGKKEKKKNKEKLVEHVENNIKNEKERKTVKEEEYAKPAEAKPAAPIWSGGLVEKIKQEAAPRTIEANFINELKRKPFDWRRFTYYSFISCFLGIAVIGGIYIWLLGKEKEIRAKIDPIKNEIAQADIRITALKKESKKVDDFKDRMSIISGMLDRHAHWTNLFAFLEENTLADIDYVNKFSGKIDGNIILEAKAGNFLDLTNQISVYNDSGSGLLKEVSVNQASFSSGSQGVSSSTPYVQFPVNLVFEKSIFFNAKQ